MKQSMCVQCVFVYSACSLCVYLCVCVYLMIQRQKLLLLYVSETSDELNDPFGPLSRNCPSHAVTMETRVMMSQEVQQQ